MHILITGAAGFIGQALARQLASQAHLQGQPITRLTLVDQHLGTSAPPGATCLCMDLGDHSGLQRTEWLQTVDVVFHLASMPGGAAEQDPDGAVKINLRATETLLEWGRRRVLAGHPPPMWVFASSIAVLGHQTAPVDDQTLPRPGTSYGAHKWIGEILVADYSRRGWVDGRSVRLPGVLARPATRTGQASAFLSDLIRELAHQRPFVCPTAPGAQTWVSSLPCVVGQLLHAAEMPLTAGSHPRTWTLPTTHVSMQELVEAVGRVYGVPSKALVRYDPDVALQHLFASFPPLSTPAANTLGFLPDPDLDTLVSRALAGDAAG